MSREVAMNAPFKVEAHKLVDELPATADWNELIYRAMVRKQIEAGLADSTADLVTPVEDVLREFDLAE